MLNDIEMTFISRQDFISALYVSIGMKYTGSPKEV